MQRGRAHHVSPPALPPHLAERVWPVVTVAVVGAGISGLAAAQALAANEVQVRVFERGRGVGGRAGHRRRGDLAFDHGAQYFTVRDPRLLRHLRSWVETGTVARWDARIVALRSDGARAATSPLSRYVGAPGMNAVALQLARGLDVNLECTVSEARREGGVWFLDMHGAAVAGPFDALVLAMPPEQSARLLAPALRVDALAQASSLPCWCAMAAFDAPLPLDFDGAFVNGVTLDWVARDSSKPGRPPGERWTVHATPAWSASRLASPRDDVAVAMLTQLFAVLDVPARQPVHLAAHRWSLARPGAELELQCLWRAEHALALCGDWCLGGRMEGAYLSGVAAAERVLAPA